MDVYALLAGLAASVLAGTATLFLQSMPEVIRKLWLTVAQGSAREWAFREEAEQTFDRRVQGAVAALTLASATLKDLERELQERTSAVLELQERHRLLELDRDQVEAVAAELTGVVKRESKRSIGLSVLASALFFVAGIIVTLLTTGGS